MAEFLRPQARATLWRWRDVLLGLAICVVGAWWAATSNSAVRFLGYGAVGIGVFLMIGGWQRMRFDRGNDGPGTVKIVERRLAYFGPLTGGVIELDDVTRLEYDGTSHPAHWVLTAPGGQVLQIPVNADGAETLFDLFESLPGLRTSTMLAVLDRTDPARVTVWERGPTLLQ